MLLLPPFAPLLDTSDAISTVLAQTKDLCSADSYKNQPDLFDASINSTLVSALDKHKRLDRAALLEASFKLKLTSIQDELGTDFGGLKDTMFRCLDLLLRCAELDLVESTTPLNYIEEVLDFQTVEFSMHLHDYLESRVKRLTANMNPAKGKGLTFLRLCNELLRRLSKTKNTKSCGRISMLLSSIFPITERSGVNLKGDFNTDNITLIESDDMTVVPDLTPPHPRKEDETRVPSAESMDVDEDSNAAPKDEKKAGDSIKTELNFYAEFWGLQAFFCNPATLINSPKNIAKFQQGIEHTLDRFAAVEEGNQKDLGQGAALPESPASTSESATNHTTEQLARVDSSTNTKRKHSHIADMVPEPTTYFPKFLTSPKLLQLEIADPYFRKHILVQFLIVIQYLEGHNGGVKDAYAKISTPNRVFQPQWIMEEKDQEWVASIKPKIFKELKVSGIESGDKDFVKTVQAVLRHEEAWIQWKAESCPRFEKPSMSEADVEETRLKRQRLSASLAPLKQKLGCSALTELWRQVDEQIEEGAGIGSIRLPQTVDEYLSGLPFAARRAQAMRIREGKPAYTQQELKELEQARLWRGLRLGSRQYLHLYGKFVTDPNYSVATLTADIKEDERWEEEIKKNGGKVPKPKVVEKPAPETAATEAPETNTSQPENAEQGNEGSSEGSKDEDADMREADAEFEKKLNSDDSADRDRLTSDIERAESTAVSPAAGEALSEMSSTSSKTTETDTEPIVISLTNK
ncbi:THO complex subunit 1 transcription elongation factor-domain-containing protein [Dissophora ornata]|nr:hypothetical protein BGZ58_006947 [Dissophora ornata]KAI8605651.1 THO complex subunit 1 transcription elongation factor-domain-containing protein [Dissophora ornata]